MTTTELLRQARDSGPQFAAPANLPTILAAPTILAQVFVDRIAWFIANGRGLLLGHGRVDTFEDLRGVQIRAGVLEVLLHRAGKGFELPKALTYCGQWRVMTSLERENLENFFALVNGGKAEDRAEKVSTGNAGPISQALLELPPAEQPSHFAHRQTS